MKKINFEELHENAHKEIEKTFSDARDKGIRLKSVRCPTCRNIYTGKKWIEPFDSEFLN